MTLYGQCNIPAGLTASKIAAGGYHTIILKADGAVTAFGRTGYDQTIVPAGLVAKQIAGGEFHSLAINMSNSAVTWGSNINGETNIGSSCESFNQKQCSFKSGVFRPGATQCSACANNVNCCVNGVHSYILAETCAALGGIAFQGENNPLVCETGAFCEGITCAGITLNGYDLTGEFIIDGDCGDCIMGNCCVDDAQLYTTLNECAKQSGIFYPGIENQNACFAGVTYGICCTGGTCSNNIEQSDCDGYFVSNIIAAENNISCVNGGCDIGICCKENAVTSVTGGVCVGIITRAECALTGGDFFASSEGYTCSNCSYIPAIASALFERISNNIQTGGRKTRTYSVSEIGITGTEIQPRNETATNTDTWLNSSSVNYYGAGATIDIADFHRETYVYGSGRVHFRFRYPNFSIFRPWYNSGVTMHNPNLQGLTNGSFDAPPAGATSDNGGITMAYIMGANLANVYNVPRYLRFVFDYGNPDSQWYGQSIVMRYMGITQIGTVNSRSVEYSLEDATRHSGVTISGFNAFPSPNPLWEDVGTSYSSGVLVQAFAENPLKYRVRQVGSCCKGITCLGILTQDQCAFTGGTFFAEQGCWACDRSKVLGNCCTGGTYYGYTNGAICDSLGGYFKKSKTLDTNVCIYGSECNADETCVGGNIYFGQYTGGIGATFVAFSYARNLGCSACDRGICCVGLTCNGYIPREICSDLSGTFYENDSTCGELCLTGICCDLTQNSCGTFTNKANCRGVNQYFFVGYTAGQTCSACNSLVKIETFASGVTFTYTLNKGTTYGTFQDGSLWVQETNNLRLLNVRLKYDDAESTSHTKVVGGKEHTVALAEYSGFVLGYGNNLYGQSGVTREYSFRKTYNILGEGFTDIAAGFYHTLAVSNGGTVSAWGRNIYGESTVPNGLTGVKAVSAGEYHSVALKTDGGVTCWGSNIFGQCNIPSGLTGVTAISCGAVHTLALKNDGTLVAWGGNSYGQLNIPAGLTGVSQISAGYYHNVVIFGANSGITAWGRTLEKQCNVSSGLTGVYSVAAGGYHTLYLRKRGTTPLIGGTGSNSHGQLKLAYGYNASIAVAAGENHSLAKLDKTSTSAYGTVTAWGSTSSGQVNLKNLSEYSANTKIQNLQLTPSGYEGTIYIHGMVKNQLPLTYIDPTSGAVSGNVQPFTSLHYDSYDEGWKGPYTITATEDSKNYPTFNLNKFESNKTTLDFAGFTMVAGDVFMCNTTNFSIYRKNYPNNASGYPYQLQQSRANALAYGIVNCLSATGAALAGSTLCFRPPNQWSPEDIANKPIYPVSLMEGKIPGQPGNTLLSSTTVTYTDVKNALTSCSQVSEFGNGVDYGVPTPMWAMNGYGVQANSYGEQFLVAIHQMLEVVHATGSAGTILSENQRRDLLSRIVQYGLDAWGTHKVYCLNLSSGAGQKAGRTRGWIPLAGYFLGATAMYDPEATMLLDSARLQKFIQYYYNSDPAQLPGPGATFPPGTCSTAAQWRKFRYGDTGPQNNFEGIRRLIARTMSHEVNTMVELINDPSNLLRHYEYPGTWYKNTQFYGFGQTGATGVTFYNEFSTRVISPDFAKISVSGNFGVMRWGSSASSANPFPGRFTSETKEGTGESIRGGWLRVESGPGSSGASGATMSRFYKILYSNGFRDDSDPVSNSLGGGYQIVLGQTWADGTPDHTSTIKYYPATETDAGITRPSTFHPLGYTYSPVIFLINNNPLECGLNQRSDSILWDASSSSGTDYFGVSLDAWLPQYMLADYIMRTKGVTLISDVAPIPDYIRQYIYTSPYNIISLFAWYNNGTNSVLDTWIGTQWDNNTLAKSRINFKDHFPGVVTWKGLTV